ncbi:MAG: hypothetical protein ACP5VR_09345 [Acidimicrobiales bacterium]
MRSSLGPLGRSPVASPAKSGHQLAMKLPELSVIPAVPKTPKPWRKPGPERTSQGTVIAAAQVVPTSAGKGALVCHRH